MAIIYILTNISNGKQYIGKTKYSFNVRMYDHLWSANTKRYNSALHAAIRKYGINNFHVECLEISDSLANLWEKHLIKRWSSKAPCGYNLTDGGEGAVGATSGMGGRKHSESTLQKMRLAARNNVRTGKFNNPMAGKFGNKHHRSKAIVLIHPDGKEENFSTIRAACIKYNLDSKCLMRVLKYKTQKQTKGFKAYYANLGI